MLPPRLTTLTSILTLLLMGILKDGFTIRGLVVTTLVFTLISILLGILIHTLMVPTWVAGIMAMSKVMGCEYLVGTTTDHIPIQMVILLLRDILTMPTPTPTRHNLMVTGLVVLVV
jgi:hypothetical protein